ncbi:hypothetical protein A9Q84_01240 [Halobacteriovorax marinus]|uniref:Acyl carrier protein n=1 Tax=Halobacteriovorax marinus TaxID=97084 RepID=A0A1Y5FIJ3_9BACT|nr:hypothetical protein A9Q84_01240 [Halobacteriovorax marinus]
MVQEELISKINVTLSEEFELPIEKLTSEAHLVDDLGLDSLDAVDMLVHIEDELGMKLDVEKVQHARTLGDIYKLIGEVSSDSN